MNKKINTSVFKNIIKVIVSIFLMLYLFFAPMTVFKVLQANQNFTNKKLKVDYMGILELWNIDTFEGGSVSRTRYLEKQALEFENENCGVFIMVNNMSVEQAKLNLEANKKPDLVSFGIGVGNELINSLIKLNTTFGVRNDLLNGGKCNGYQYAIPYILGGYVIISDNDYQQNNSLQNLGYGGNGYNNSLISLLINKYEVKSQYDQNINQDTFTCYDRYLDKKFDTLLGTQRDLYRVKNRIDKGNMNDKKFCYLSGYSDLIQYIGICSTDLVRQNYCNKFIKQLVSRESQNKLKDINMFSVLDESIYQSDEFFEMEKQLNKPLKTLNVFFNNAKLDEIKELSLLAINKDKKSLEKLKKYLV